MLRRDTSSDLDISSRLEQAFMAMMRPERGEATPEGGELCWAR